MLMILFSLAVTLLMNFFAYANLASMLYCPCLFG